MPFCTNCGTMVDARASFCHNCGSPQRSTSHQFNDVLNGISERAACILCYIPIFGVIPAIVFLASQRFRTEYLVRFNAFQALYLFVAWLIVSSAAPTLLFTSDGLERAALSLLKLALFFCWVYLLVKAANRQQVRIPIIGDLAARSTNEQY